MNSNWPSDLRGVVTQWVCGSRPGKLNGNNEVPSNYSSVKHTIA